MAVTKADRIIRVTADDDVVDLGGIATKIKGVRLAAGTAKATAEIRKNDSNGNIIYALRAVSDAADESNICTQVDTGMLHVDISGSGAEVYIYLE